MEAGAVSLNGLTPCACQPDRVDSLSATAGTDDVVEGMDKLLASLLCNRAFLWMRREGHSALVVPLPDHPDHYVERHLHTVLAYFRCPAADLLLAYCYPTALLTTIYCCLTAHLLVP